MQALPIIEALDILKDRVSGFGAILKRALMRELVFQRTEKTFHHGIVIAVALATQAQHDPATGQNRAIQTRRILVALVTGMKEGRCAHAMRQASTTRVVVCRSLMFQPTTRRE